MDQPATGLVGSVEQLDAAGRHGEAVDLLAAAARRGDDRARALLGQRLLVGDRAPLLPADGLRLLRDAARGGDAIGLERLAAFAAGGFGAAVDAAAALQLLGRAADQGSTSAAGQRRALQAQLPDWHRPPAVRPLESGGRVVHCPAFAHPAVCDWLIGRAHGRLARARVYDSVAQRETTSAHRNNTAATFDLVTTDAVQFLVQQRMADACGFALTQFESPAILHYDPGESIRDHYDFIDPNSPDYAQQIARQGQRMLTFLLYLNDDYDGGETDFPRLGLRHRGVRGDALFFLNAHADGRADLDMLHAGLPPRSGEKWIVSQFVRNHRLRD